MAFMRRHDHLPWILITIILLSLASFCTSDTRADPCYSYGDWSGWQCTVPHTCRILELVMSGDHLFAVDEENNFLVYDWTPDGTAALITSISLGGYYSSLAVGDTLAVAVGTETGISIVSIADPIHPVLRGTMTTPGESRDVEIVGNRAVVADGPEGVHLIDISEPEDPMILDTFVHWDRSDYLRREGDLLCAYEKRDGVDSARLLKILDSDEIVLRNEIHPGCLGDLILSGTFVYSLHSIWYPDEDIYNYFLRCIDISDPSQPTYIGGTSLPTYYYGLFALSDGLIGFSAPHTLIVVDVTNPSSPNFLYGLTFRGAWCQSDGDFIILPYYPDAGFVTYRLTRASDAPVLDMECASYFEDSVCGGSFLFRAVPFQWWAYSWYAVTISQDGGLSTSSRDMGVTWAGSERPIVWSNERVVLSLDAHRTWIYSLPNLERESEYEPSWDAMCTATHDGILYSVLPDSLGIYDLNGNMRPAQVSVVPFAAGDGRKLIDYYEGYLYVVLNGPHELRTVDVRDPTNPIPTSVLPLEVDGRGIRHVHDLLIIDHYTSDDMYFRIQDRAHPVPITVSEFDPILRQRKIAASSGRTLYSAVGSRLHVDTVHALDDIESIGTYPYCEQIVALHLSDRFLMVEGTWTVSSFARDCNDPLPVALRAFNGEVHAEGVLLTVELAIPDHDQTCRILFTGADGDRLVDCRSVPQGPFQILDRHPDALAPGRLAYELQTRRPNADWLTLGTISLFRPAGVAAHRPASAFPNPCNPATSVTFSLDRPSRVEVSVFDLAGRRVRRLLHGNLPVGIRVVSWDGRDDRGLDAASGPYVIRIEQEGRAETVKVTLVR